MTERYNRLLIGNLSCLFVYFPQNCGQNIENDPSLRLVKAWVTQNVPL